MVSALADRLTHGVRGDAVEIARIRARGVGRTYMRKLVDAGLATRELLRAAGAEAVQEVIRNKAVFTALWSALGRKTERKLRAADGEAPAWTAAASPPPSPPEMSPAGPLLIVDLAERRVVYRGVEIPTRPPHSLQRQPLLALAVLAANAGRAIAIDVIAGEMQRIGDLPRRLVTPEPRDLRYKLLTPFRHALQGKVPHAEIDRLVESVSRNSLRLNVPGPVSLVAPAATASPRR
jgi:hypothetical protein